MPTGRDAADAHGPDASTPSTKDSAASGTGAQGSYPVDCRAIWDAVTGILQQQESLSQQRLAFLRLTSLRAIVNGTALLDVPDVYTRRQIEAHLRAPIIDALTRHFGRRMDIAVAIQASQTGSQTDAATVTGEPASHPPADERVNRLNPTYTFESFVVAVSNRFAHAAAYAVAETPGRAYNPLFIYGGSASERTHLLNAVGHCALALGTARSVLYVTAEEFTSDFINSVRDGTVRAFRRRYRDGIDMLLVDGIQFLENRERTQEEFLHTFTALYDASKQIVIASDRKPTDLGTLGDRLRARFEWGLVTDIKPPDRQTRLAILQRKRSRELLPVPDEVINLIASKITTSMQDVEEALRLVTALAGATGATVDVRLAGEALRNFVPDGSAPQLTIDQIAAAVCGYFGVSVDELRGQSDSEVVVNARQVAMYLCRELTDMSLFRIGQAFGGRDDTAVMDAERRIRQLMSQRPTT